MSFSGWGYNFEGPYSSPDRVPAAAGVYIVWCYQDNVWSLLDVGQAKDMRERLMNHERADCWRHYCRGSICFYLVVIPAENERRELEQSIRRDKNPLCGEI